MGFRSGFFNQHLWYFKIHSLYDQVIDNTDNQLHLKSLWAQIRVSSNGLLYSLSPFNIQTINSLAYINKFLFYLVILFLIYKKAINNLLAIFLIVSPTIIIHTSTSLRDIVVVILLVLGSYYTFKEKNFGIQLLICFALSLFRSQYLIIFLAFMFFEFFFGNYYQKKKVISGYIILFLSIILIGFNLPEILEVLNKYRIGFYAEENTYGNLAWTKNYEEFQISIETFQTIIIQNIKYIFTPFSINNIFYFVLTIENIIFFIVLIFSCMNLS